MKILETADQLPVLHVLAARQTIFYFVFIRGFCRGLFDFILTCLYQNNISVDAEWHITCLVDLEWTCTKPNKIFRSSFWLIDKGVDQSILMEYNSIWYKSIEDLTIEERKLESVALVNLETSRPRLSNIIFNLGKTEHFGTLQGSQAVLICLWYLQDILNHYSAKTLMKKNLSGCFQFFPKRTSEYCRSQTLAGQEAYDEDPEQAFSEDWTEIILSKSSYMSWTVLFTLSHAV